MVSDRRRVLLSKITDFVFFSFPEKKREKNCENQKFRVAPGKKVIQ